MLSLPQTWLARWEAGRDALRWAGWGVCCRRGQSWDSPPTPGPHLRQRWSTVACWFLPSHCQWSSCNTNPQFYNPDSQKNFDSKTWFNLLILEKTCSGNSWFQQKDTFHAHQCKNTLCPQDIKAVAIKRLRDKFFANSIVCVKSKIYPPYNNLPEYVCEEPIGPLACVGVQHSVQCLLADSLGVDDVSDSLHALKVFQRLEQHPPRRALARPTWPHHHQAMVQVTDLIQLQNLRTQTFCVDYARLLKLTKGVNIQNTFK